MAEPSTMDGFESIEGVSEVNDDLFRALSDTSGGLEQSRYDFTYRVFPSDLGKEDNDHYMIININAPSTLGELAGTINSGTLLRDEFSKVDQLRFGPEGSFATGDKTALYRSTRRIAESIALYMPNGGLVYTEDNKYEEVSMTALAGSFMSGIAETIFGKFGATVVDTIGSVVTTGAKLAGYPINPMVEVLFATRPMREWMFEVLLAPRNKEESDTVHEIIRTMRLYSAPELTGFGFFLIPPAEFDITFYRNGKENEYLPRINTCVLKRFEVDYAPAEGKYSTFSTGAPVAVRMSMNFQEVEMLHKKRVAQGF
jgi:hypothetical protein